MSAAIRRRHGNRCTTPSRCNCPFEANVFDRHAGRKIRKTFPTLQAAKRWQRDTQQGVENRTVSAAETPTLAEAEADLVEGMRSGAIRTRSGVAIKPSVVRGYGDVMRLHVLPTLGGRRLSAISRNDVQDLVDALVADGLSAGTDP